MYTHIIHTEMRPQTIRTIWAGCRQVAGVWLPGMPFPSKVLGSQQSAISCSSHPPHTFPTGSTRSVSLPRWFPAPPSLSPCEPSITLPPILILGNTVALASSHLPALLRSSLALLIYLLPHHAQSQRLIPSFCPALQLALLSASMGVMPACRMLPVLSRCLLEQGKTGDRHSLPLHDTNVSMNLQPSYSKYVPQE